MGRVGPAGSWDHSGYGDMFIGRWCHDLCWDFSGKTPITLLLSWRRNQIFHSLLPFAAGFLPSQWQRTYLPIQGDMDLIPESEDPWRRKWQLNLLCSCLRILWQRTLVGYSPWGRKDLGYDLPSEHAHTHALQLLDLQKIQGKEPNIYL